MSRRGAGAPAAALPAPADCAVERGVSSLVDPTGTGSAPPPSSDVIVRLMALGQNDGYGDVPGMASNQSIARGLIEDARLRLANLLEDWTSVTLGAPLTQRISNRARERAGHAIIELAPSLGRRRLWRTDGVKNDRARPVLATGGEVCGPNWRLVLEEWPRLKGSLADAGEMTLADDAIAAVRFATDLLAAHAAIVATGAADDPRCGRTRTLLTGLAHHDACVRERPGGESEHLRPATIMLSATPWSKPSLRHRFPHTGIDARGIRPKLPAKGFPVPGGVTIAITDAGVTLSPMRVIVGAHPEPLERLRAIASLSEDPRP